jgi:hypothetical protein
LHGWVIPAGFVCAINEVSGIDKSEDFFTDFSASMILWNRPAGKTFQEGRLRDC